MKLTKMKVVVVLLILSLVLTVFAGCGGAESTEGEPAEVDLLTMIISSGPVYDWDPAIMFSTDNLILCNMYETLLRYNPETDEYMPLLTKTVLCGHSKYVKVLNSTTEPI